MSDSLYMQEYLAQFTTRPVNTKDVTQVTCIHPFFGTVIYYLKVDEYRKHFHGVTRLCWINGYTIILTPLE